MQRRWLEAVSLLIFYPVQVPSCSPLLCVPEYFVTSCQTRVPRRAGLALFPARGGAFPWRSTRQLTPAVLLALCPWQTETEDEKRRFEEGKGRYLQTKAKRQAQVQQAARQ